VLLVASANGLIGFPPAIEILTSGGAALDAAEAAVRAVEDNPDDHTVGYGGYPNLDGEVELDASIMDGASRRAGAVGALKGYRYAITVARAVMERLPHVLLAGDGAARFAARIGMEAENLLTPEAERAWRDGIEGRGAPDGLGADILEQVRALTSDPDHVAGTVNVIAIDGRGDIASAVSTSGWAWKHPGRMGDTPVIGAGNYADNRYGAAGCTGFGELAIRCSTARSIVSSMAAGASVVDACRDAMTDLNTLGEEPRRVIMNAVAVDATGDHCGISTTAGREYAAWRDGEPRGVLLPRLHVAVT
jgi:beta-aspartyl-peptidase (threonine type)